MADGYYYLVHFPDGTTSIANVIGEAAAEPLVSPCAALAAV